MKMGKFIDLTGQIFGTITVIKRIDNYISPNGSISTMYLCRCSCGRMNNFSVRAASLRSGNTRGCVICGHEKIGRSLFENLIDLSFGSLTVVAFDRIELGKTYWICRCNCERSDDFSVLAASLKGGKSTRCDICRYEKVGQSSFHDLTNFIFGFLVVESFDKIKNSTTYWNCYCDPKLGGCGNRKSIAAECLNENQKSCGCLVGSWISKEMKNYFKSFYGGISEYKIFRNPETGYWLPFDIYLPSQNVFIEIHGEQHYCKNGFHIMQSKISGKTQEEEFKYQKHKDRMKKKFAKKNGTYIEIDLRKIKTTEQAIKHIEQTLFG
jgi:hypothetical protein